MYVDSLRPDDSLAILTMALSIGFPDSVSFLLTIQATGLLTVTSVGFPPTEYASLCWTHQHAGLSRRTCTPALPASALPADVYPESAGPHCQPPPCQGWGIVDWNFGEFSTGIDSPYQNPIKTPSEPAIRVIRRAKSRFPKLLRSLNKPRNKES